MRMNAWWWAVRPEREEKQDSNDPYFSISTLLDLNMIHNKTIHECVAQIKSLWKIKFGLVKRFLFADPPRIQWVSLTGWTVRCAFRLKAGCAMQRLLTFGNGIRTIIHFRVANTQGQDFFPSIALIPYQNWETRFPLLPPLQQLFHNLCVGRFIWFILLFLWLLTSDLWPSCLLTAHGRSSCRLLRR